MKSRFPSYLPRSRCSRSPAPALRSNRSSSSSATSSPTTRPKARRAEVQEAGRETHPRARCKVEVYPELAALRRRQGAGGAAARRRCRSSRRRSSKFDRYTQKFQVFDLPFLFDDVDAVDRFQTSPRARRCSRSSMTKGITGLAYWHNGMKQLSAPTRRAQAPGRRQGPEVPHPGIRRARGASSGARRQSAEDGLLEVYQALQTGVVDGQENTWSNIYSQKIHEVQKTIAETNHGVIDYMVVTNEKWWNGLPADIREGPRQAMAEATAYGNKLANDINERRQEAHRRGRQGEDPEARQGGPGGLEKGDGAGLEEVRGRTSART